MIFGYVGACLFALSGSLAAARSKRTPLTFALFAFVTATGGGTLTALLLGEAVPWLHDRILVACCLVIAAAVWATPLSWWPGRTIKWLDAVAINAYSIVGTTAALTHGVATVSAALIGTIAACAGGVTREVLAGEPLIVLGPEIYVTAAALTSFTYAMMSASAAPDMISKSIAFSAGFGLRAFAIMRDVRLPTYGR